MSTIQIYDGEKFVPFNISNAIEMPVGFEDYVSYTELDPGQLIRNGQLVSREIYSDLWNFVQSKPLRKALVFTSYGVDLKSILF